MTRYVAGFAFFHNSVALVVKNRPEWQKGKMNGIGGHIEEGETPIQAMVREFFEETGVQTTEEVWKNFAVLSGKGFEVSFFYAVLNTLSNLETKTDERIVVVPLQGVTIWNSIPNLTWSIPMARSMYHDKAERFLIEEDM